MTTPTTLYRYNDQPDAPYAFDHNDMCIVNPMESPYCGLPACPSEYGFVAEGITTWGRDFVLADGRAVHMTVNTMFPGRVFLLAANPLAHISYRIDSSDDPLRMADVLRFGAEF